MTMILFKGCDATCDGCTGADTTCDSCSGSLYQLVDLTCVGKNCQI